jgi:hypothetical protein
MKNQERKYMTIPEGITNEEIISSFNEEHLKHGKVIETKIGSKTFLRCTKCAGATMYISPVIKDGKG